MVMALSALESQAQEKLRRVFELGIGIFDLPIPGHWRILTELARRGDNFARKLVVGFVDQQTLTDPVVKSICAARVCWRAPLIAQQRAPFIGEVICVIAAVEQGVNPLLAFGRVLIG